MEKINGGVKVINTVACFPLRVLVENTEDCAPVAASANLPECTFNCILSLCILLKSSLMYVILS